MQSILIFHNAVFPTQGKNRDTKTIQKDKEFLSKQMLFRLVVEHFIYVF